MSVPFDRSFKLLTGDDPRAARAGFAGIPLDAEIEVEPASRELNQSTLRVDNLYCCRRNDEEFIVHFEAVSSYRDSALDRQADYVRAEDSPLGPVGALPMDPADERDPGGSRGRREAPHRHRGTGF